MSLRTDVLELPRQTDAFRIVHGEGDGLSGLVIDRYAETCVVSLYAAGWMKAAEILEAEIQKLDGIDRVLFRADARTQKLEGFRIPDISPGERARIREGKLRYEVDLATGHKTGLFLDQRDNRKRVASFARGRRVLDLCTNAGGFALSCRGPGKARHVTAVDLDEDAVAAARRNARLNNLRIAFQHADLFPFLRERVEAGDQWDLIVLDPPKLAHGKGEVDAALTRYQDMNRLALSAAAPGAIMLTCSCSGAVEESAFLGAVRRAAVDAQRSVRVIELRGASSDHPVALDFSEGRYLKGALLHVD